MLEFKEIIGRFTNYTSITANDGYCFYDADLPQDERNYMQSIDTPILDRNILERKFIAVLGNADELNKQLEKERQEKENANGNL